MTHRAKNGSDVLYGEVRACTIGNRAVACRGYFICRGRKEKVSSVSQGTGKSVVNEQIPEKESSPTQVQFFVFC